jgi:hypothetical protein
MANDLVVTQKEYHSIREQQLKLSITDPNNPGVVNEDRFVEWLRNKHNVAPGEYRIIVRD